jgi:hypothetical protein
MFLFTGPDEIPPELLQRQPGSTLEDWVIISLLDDEEFIAQDQADEMMVDEVTFLFVTLLSFSIISRCMLIKFVRAYVTVWRLLVSHLYVCT